LNNNKNIIAIKKIKNKKDYFEITDFNILFKKAIEIILTK